MFEISQRIAGRSALIKRDFRMVTQRLIFGRAPAAVLRVRTPEDLRARNSVTVKGVFSGPGKLLTEVPRTQGRPLTVTNVVHETADAVSIYLAEADGSPIAFTAGQFLSVDVEVEGEVLRRAYSLAGPALPGADPHITIKRITDGRVSSQLKANIQPGDIIRALGPSGSFCLPPRVTDQPRELVMIAGGSGITPVISILETTLATEADAQVTLLYGNRAFNDIIFASRLSQLCIRFGNRLTVRHTLQAPHDEWTGATGLLCDSVLSDELSAVNASPNALYFVCGPGAMMDSANDELQRRGIALDRVFEEKFVHPEHREASAGSHVAQNVTITLRSGKTIDIVVPPRSTILDSAVAQGVVLPYSCAMGGCGACRVKRVGGELEMDEPNCLTSAERAAGFVLTCVSRPNSSCTLQVVS